MTNFGTSWAGSSDATRERFERAVNVGNAGTALLQTFINRTVQQLTLREFGLQAVLSRRAGSGDAEYINRREAGTNGATWLADTDPVAEETGTYGQVSFPYRSLVTRGKVTRKLQATGRSYADILALEMAAKAEDFANALETGMISANSLGSADANAPAGFLTLIQQINSFDMSQTVSNAGATTANAALSLAKLDEAIDRVKGSAQRGDLVIIGSFGGIRSVNAALQAQQRFNDVVEIAAGFRVRTYDGIPLVVSTSMPNDLNFNAAGAIKDTSGAGTALMVLNTRYNYIAELTPTTVMPIAKTDSQFDQFDMYWDGSNVLSNTKGAALLTHIG
tara:strand:+ start:3840 stop:4841 length:1002 start_codon:yes stop_codon:yes gene_type:complete